MSKPKFNLTVDVLKEHLTYDPDTGVFIRVKSHRLDFVGVPTGSPGGDGYIYIRLRRQQFIAHRLAWLYVYGEWPKNEIDHINGVHGDNRIQNLRDVSTSGNQQNQKTPQIHNKSGFLGVDKLRTGKKWRAQITVNNRKIYLGVFKTPEDAHQAYLQAKRQLHSTCTI